MTSDHDDTTRVTTGDPARVLPAGTAGLRWFTLEVPGQAAIDAVAGRLAGAGWPFQRLADGISVADPAQNALRVVGAAR